MELIRPYKTDEYPEVLSWWEQHKEVPPLPSMVPPTSYILETDGVPHYMVSIVLTNVPAYCHAENFCRNPHLPASSSAVTHLLEYIGNIAKLHGHTHLICLAHTEPTKKRYEALGFTKVFEGFASFCMPLE